MERITISLDSDLADKFDAFISEQGYTNRSEAMRDLIRQRLETENLETIEDGFCMATLSYVYNHHELELASRITNAHHHHHELSLATTHVHLDHDHCLEVAIMRGPVKDVREFANFMMAERGVRHGKLNMIPIAMSENSHDAHGTPHVHSKPVI
jgi:CopG family nickel-responsive transcriptional regulator